MSGATNGNGRQHARIHKDELPIILAKELSGCAWAVYVALRTRSNPGSEFWTDAPTLNEIVGQFYHKTTVSRAIGELSGKGLIERTGRTNRARYNVLTLDTASSENANSCGQTTDDKAKTISENANSCGQTISENAQTISVFASLPPETASQTAASRPPNRQNKQKEKTNKERGAIAPVAACAAPPPAVFLQDQNQNQNPEPELVATESTVPDSDTVTEPTKTEPTATAAEPTPATQHAKPRQRGKKVKRGTRLTLEELPDDWRAWSEDFIEHHDIGNLLDIAEMWPLFRDHYRTTSGKSAVQLDWLAVWKNWWRRDLKNLNQRPSTRKILGENRSARARREAEQRRWEEQRAADERKEREAAERKERDERRRIELAPTVARVKAYIMDLDHGMTAVDVANALDMSEQDLEAVYRAGLARDPDIICYSPLLAPSLAPSGEWISVAAKKARDAEKKAREAAQKAAAPTQRTRATDAWAWYEDAQESPQAAPEAAPPPPPPEPPPPPTASAPTPADVEEAARHVEAAGPRGIEINEISWISFRAVAALCKEGRARINGAIITSTRFDAKNKSAEPKPLGEVLHRFNTSTSTTSTVSITGRAVL